MATLRAWRRMSALISLAVVAGASLASPAQPKDHEPPAPLVSQDFDSIAVGTLPPGLSVTTPAYKAAVRKDDEDEANAVIGGGQAA